MTIGFKQRGWLILFLERFFAENMTPGFFSASMKTGVKLLGGTVTRCVNTH